MGCQDLAGSRFATVPSPPFAAGDAIGISATAGYSAVDGDTVQFSSSGSYDLAGAATEAWDFGDTTSSAPAPLGTSPAHTYPGPGTYDYILTVRDTASGKTAQATGVVTILASGGGPIAVAKVVVQPAQLDGHVGDVFALRAVAYDASDNILSGQTFTWTSDNHTVAADPASGATTTATALATGSANLQAHVGAVDSNVVPMVISAVMVITGLDPNLPGGYSIPTGYEIDCSAVPQGVYTPVYNNPVVENASIYSPGGGIAAPVNPPASPPSIYVIKYPAGMAQGIAPLVINSVDFTSRGWHKLYLRGFVQLSSNFYGHPSNVNKILTANIHGSPCFVLEAYGAGSGGLQWSMNLQDLGVGVPGGAINFFSGRPVTRGLWQRVSCDLIANTPGLLDGVIRLWLSNYDVSGKLVAGPIKVIEQTNIGWSATGQPNVWNFDSINPIWGGNTPGVVMPATQYLFVDDYVTAGAV